jgi:Rad3-related DNA helicase
LEIKKQSSAQTETELTMETKVSRSWSAHFPYPTFRPKQEYCLDWIWFETEKKTKVIVVEGPTAFGKSAIAIALLNRLGTGAIVVPDNFLMTQYLKVEPALFDVKGKSHYDCLNPDYEGKQYKCSNAPCVEPTLEADEIKAECQSEQRCLYYNKISGIKKQSKVLLNYDNFLIFRKSLDEKEITVLDECHKLEEKLRNFATLVLDFRILKVVLGDHRNLVNELAQAISTEEVTDWVSNKVIPVINELKQSGSMSSALDNLLFNLKNYLDKANGGADYLFVKESNCVLLKPFNLKQWAKDIIDGSKVTLMMSGTILDKKVFCESLGLDETEVAFLKLGSNIPRKNRSVKVLPVASMSKKNIDTTWSIISRCLSDILEAHGFDKGIIHTNSNPIADLVYNRFGSDDRMIFVRNEKSTEEAIEKHKKSSKPTVLVAASLTTGLDLADDLCRFAVILKVPFPNLGDVVFKKISDENQERYDWYALTSLMQMIGRGVRGPSDYALTYVLDSDISNLIMRCQKWCPPDLLNAMAEGLGNQRLPNSTNNGSVSNAAQM